MTFDELMNVHPDNQENYNKIFKYAKTNVLIPFIGAGMSAFTYPSWGILLEQIGAENGLLKEVKEFLTEGLFEKAASFLENRLAVNEFRNKLEKTFDPIRLENNNNLIPDYYRAIPKIFPGNIITTNFDRMIEILYQNKIESVLPQNEFDISRIKKAVQSNSQLLFKLHGDVKNIDHLILTKEEYDVAYGLEATDEEKPMVSLLQDIMKSRIVLFLGCSLSEDRFMEIIKNCADMHYKYYALVELPECTINDIDKLKPILKDSDGYLIQGYEKKQKSLADKNIRRLWYPNGKHEAVKILLEKLSEDLGFLLNEAFDKIDIRNDKKYQSSNKLVGRKIEVINILNAVLETEETSAIFITGAPGIGKTRACQVVYQTLKKSHVNIDIPFFDMLSVNSLAVFFNHIAEALNIEIPASIENKDYHTYLLKKIINKSEAVELFIMYFDNWEDVWLNVSENEADRSKIINWFKDLSYNKIKVIISSRIVPSNYGFRSFEIKPLTETESKILFQQTYMKEIEADEISDFELLIKELGGHPLAIILAACHAVDSPKLSYTIERWKKVEIYGDNTKHESIKKAVTMNWEFLKNYPASLDIWGLMALSPKEVSSGIILELKEDYFSKEEWINGLEKLHQLHLIDYPQSGVVSMLQPIKEQFYLFYDEEGKKEKTALVLRWANCLKTHFENIFPRNENYIKEHTIILNLIPQIIFVADFLVKEKTEFKILDGLIICMLDFFSFSNEAKDFLPCICEHYKDQDRSSLYAKLLQIRGEICTGPNKKNEAMEFYNEAHSLFENADNKLGLAQIYRSKGELLAQSWYSEEYVKSALYYLNQAEELLSQNKSPILLANVLLVRGNLFIKLRDERALPDLERANKFYEEEHISLGIANVKRSKSRYFADRKQFNKALESLNESEYLYLELQEKHGLSELLLSKIEILFEINEYEQMLKCYNCLELLVKETKDASKLPILKQIRASLFFVQKRPADGMKLLEESKKMFKEENGCIGIADTSSRLGMLYYHLGDYNNFEKSVCDFNMVVEKIPKQLQIEFTKRLLFTGYCCSRSTQVK